MPAARPMPTDLPENDRALVEAAQRGVPWAPAGEGQPNFDGEMPTVQASTIRALCLGLWDDVRLDPRGIHIVGVRIDGDLDLSEGTCIGPLKLRACHLTAPLRLWGATLPSLYLSASRLDAGLLADSVRITGDLVCDHGFRATGDLRLLGARVGGDMSFRTATLAGGAMGALSADGVTVEGSLFCDEGFNARGTVRLPFAQIGRDAYFRKAVLNGGETIALFADGSAIKGNLFCDQSFITMGAVRIATAHVGGGAFFHGAILNGGGESALIGDRAEIRGNLFCKDGFTARGSIKIIAARIGGSADFNGAHLDGGGNAALFADGADIRGELSFGSGFTAKGTVCLPSAHIGVTVSFIDAVLDGGSGQALNAENLKVQGGLLCRDKTRINGGVSVAGISIQGLLDWRPASWTGMLDLSHARAVVWADNWSGRKWDCDGAPRIILRDFRFDSFLVADFVKSDAVSRLNWLKAALGDDFVPGPYENLARVLRAAGDDAGAKRVGLEKERARTRHEVKSSNGRLPRSARWLWGAFLDLTIGYGYQWWRGGAFGLLFLLLVGWGVFNSSGPLDTGGSGIIKPALPVAFIEDLGRRIDDRPLWPGETPSHHGIGYRLPPEYPPFSGFCYSLDTLLPLIDLGQSGAWSPSPIAPSFWDDKRGWAVTFYLYFHIFAGWGLSTLIAVDLTGVIQRGTGRPSE
ncbi:hypothetical protein [Rhodospirillum centenum]|uniref:Membrane-associated oxidoreductase n=1 Tax=Rhodospirillum centenum (strain ATCC 51521 / SW) TaxID=414684 RepID=B6IQU3_RHOCS|nr:hypothetical protein [Rhodospirillum centenum]ACI97829.1 conserved hypothetical protein [Rhodospirillum centenum SW]